MKALLESTRDLLVYDKSKNPGGLPVLLLARLPHQLVDVLVLMATQWDQRRSGVAEPNMLAPFVLHWLLFVSDYDKAANLVFKRYRESGCIAGRSSVQVLIREFEKAEIARAMPYRAQLPPIRAEIENGAHRLRTWAERFAGLDADGDRKSGDALRTLATDNELIKRALMWLQRDYLANNFRHFDPTSNRDEDLPIDLDHLIPASKFGFNWNAEGSRPNFADPEGNFYWQRKPIGNSLGNFRWLDAAENRGRGAGEIKVLENGGDFVNDAKAWNGLIEKARWNETNVADFQRLIDLRTLDIYGELLVNGGLDAIALGAHPDISSPQA